MPGSTLPEGQMPATTDSPICTPLEEQQTFATRKADDIPWPSWNPGYHRGNLARAEDHANETRKLSADRTQQ
eukprot:CAMPEP_0115854886 /NCGR_PEP_ID=MMETSP0287-20121206/14258_1 /TAXON_ID=412157 /ORGANISM="Chrysochromulina rotalis, Strain UIO044" /LENGTH=71 /DNA_ID=CAMNT_0003309023 /DNA_START=552 /DNA_END=768 /DNA_ORIENTATION=+